MSADEPEDDAERPLELAPVSRRIQRGVDAMCGALTRSDAIGRPRIRFHTPIEPRDHEMARIDPDPAHMSRLKVTEAPREIERPASTWEAFERLTSQFILRNTHRIERYTDMSLYEYVRVADGRLRLARLVALLAEALAGAEPPIGQPLGSAGAHAWRAEREVLMGATRWSELFGRPDPEPSAEPR